MKEAKSSLKRRFQRWLITKTLMLLIRLLEILHVLKAIISKY